MGDDIQCVDDESKPLSESDEVEDIKLSIGDDSLSGCDFDDTDDFILKGKHMIEELENTSAEVSLVQDGNGEELLDNDADTSAPLFADDETAIEEDCDSTEPGSNQDGRKSVRFSQAPLSTPVNERTMPRTKTPSSKKAEGSNQEAKNRQ